MPYLIPHLRDGRSTNFTCLVRLGFGAGGQKRSRKPQLQVWQALFKSH